jgi:hypothetical protein
MIAEESKTALVQGGESHRLSAAAMPGCVDAGDKRGKSCRMKIGESRWLQS